MAEAALPRVLIVDDEALDLELIKLHLRAEDLAVETARDGAEAWELLSAAPETFDVVLLDRSMPRMNGMELLARIKSDERLRVVPVILQTAFAKREEILEGIRAGAYYYLTKPYDPEMLRTVVRTAIDDHCRYRELQEEVRKGNDTLALMFEARFAFRTIEQAHDLGTLLANTCPNPAATVVGLTEILVNAIEHGNLGLTYEEKTRLDHPADWAQEVDRRLALPENAEKRATVSFERSGSAIRFVIRDEGTGFDWQRYMQIDPQRAFDTHGRGIAIANRVSFSRLEYRGCGNEVAGTIDVA